MKFAICNETFAHLPLADGFRLARDIGYTGVEVAPFTLSETLAAGQTLADVRQLSPRARAATRRAAEEAGLEVVGLHWLLAKTEGYHLTTDDAAIRQRTASYLGQLTELCRDLGGELMVLGSPQQRNFPDSMTHEQAEQNAMTVLEKLLPTLEQYQVTLALEPLGPGEGNFWNHAAQVSRIVEQFESPFIKLHLDVKAMSTEGAPIEQIIRDNARHMAHFHANDPNLLGPGMGEVRFEPIFKSLLDVGYDGWVSVEVFNYEPGIEKIARDSMQNMRQALMHAESDT